MGIVAYCPNQHRVKVKSDLAGKKGVCPSCGARFRIPYVSQPEPLPLQPPVAVPAVPPPLPTTTAPAPAPAPVVKVLPVAEIVSMDPTVAAGLPRAVPLALP